MKRGLNQVLFQFTPGKTFDNPHDNAIEQVVNIEGDELENIDKQNLVNSIYYSAEDWDGGSTGFLPPDESNYAIIKPDKVISRVFPLVMRCKICGKVHDYSREREELQDSDNILCERDKCEGALTQIHHVLVCGDCSSIQNIYVPGCSEHGKKFIKLDDRADRYKNFKWVCKICDEVIGESLYGKCFDCDNTRMDATVHRASKAYRIHSMKKVDIEYSYSRTDEDSKENQEKSKVALGAYFGTFDHPQSTIENIMSLGGRDESNEQNLLKEDAIGEEQIEALKKNMPNLFEGDSKKRNIIQTVENLREDDELVSQNLMNYLLTLEEIDLDTVGGSKISISESSKDLMKDRGIDKIRLTSELPILTAVYGYHRTFDNPDKDHYPQLRSFNWVQSDGERKRPVYAKNTKTEAVFVTLDPEKVAKWLKSNNLIDETIDDKTKEQIKALVYNKMEPINPYETVNGYSDVSMYVHKLLHTMAHQMMKSGSLLSGLEETSLAEFLFPETLTFVIYANQSQSYTAGGLYTLVDRDIDRWLKNAYREGRYCIYDPVCSDQGGSCHACTHIGEVGCQYFNQNLSRATLFGEEAGTDDISGYWSD